MTKGLHWSSTSDPLTSHPHRLYHYNANDFVHNLGQFVASPVLPKMTYCRGKSDLEVNCLMIPYRTCEEGSPSLIFRRLLSEDFRNTDDPDRMKINRPRFWWAGVESLMFGIRNLNNHFNKHSTEIPPIVPLDIKLGFYRNFGQRPRSRST
eukprot:jgi/Psemu1/306133/fgenesh1_kg.236_\